MTGQHDSIRDKVAALREHAAGRRALDTGYRKEALRRLRSSILSLEGDLNAALAEDLGKHAAESYMTETGMVLESISYMLSHMRRLSAPGRPLASLSQMPARARVIPEPYGTVLVMSPWNYPLLLSLDPLVAAVAAGNSVLLKPSSYAPATAEVLVRIVEDSFERGHVEIVTGGRAENSALLEERFDYIFFTGGKQTGRAVMEKAAAHLTPVTLELGGKSPVLVCRDADIAVAARRTAFGKCLNCGQTCVAPDYVLVHEDIRDRFIAAYIAEVERMYGKDPLSDPGYGKIVNARHFDRLSALADSSDIIYGGARDRASLRMAPSIALCGLRREEPVMQEEIFGPVLPVIGYRELDEATGFILSGETPLAAYIFTRDRRIAREFTRRVPFGGGCINDTVMHLASTRMPFGGVGSSGMGMYHGKYGFSTFSHYKSILDRSNFSDLPLRYRPLKRWKEAVVRAVLR